jgi:hypothetical protein
MSQAKLPNSNAAKLVTVELLKGGRPVVGFVIGDSPFFLLLKRVTDDFLLNGFVVIPKMLIKSLKPIEDDNVFMRAARLLKLRATRQTLIGLKSWYSLIKSSQQSYGVLVVYQTEKKTNSCLLGVPTIIGKRNMKVRLIDCDGAFEQKITTLSYQGIKKIEFGGMYESTLLRLALSNLRGNEKTPSR